MNILKTTIATAAVITCCLGNTYPANAELSRREEHLFRTAKDYGYVLGLVAGGCIYYGDGLISRSTLRTMVEIANELDSTTPAFRKELVKQISNHSGGKYKACVPIVRSVMGTARTAPTSRRPYQSADYWR